MSRSPRAYSVGSHVAFAVFACVVLVTSCSWSRGGRGVELPRLERVEASSTAIDPNDPIPRRWIMESDPLSFFDFHDVPSGRDLPGAHADISPGDLALGPGKDAIQLGEVHTQPYDRFALAAWVKSPAGVFLRHVNVRGVDLELGVADGVLIAQVGEAELRSSLRIEKGVWQHVGLIVGEGHVQLVLQGQHTESFPLTRPAELGAPGRLEATVARGALDEVALFDEPVHHSVFWRARLARPFPEAPRLEVSASTGHTESIAVSRFSADGSLVVTASQDGTAKVWSARDGKLLHTLAAHASGVDHARFSPDGYLVLTAGGDGSARVWSTHDGSLLFTLPGHPQGIRHASFDASGMSILTAGVDGTAKVWSANDGSLSNTLFGHLNAVEHADFSPDGDLIVTASQDHTAKISRTYFKEVLHTLEGHSGAIRHTSFDPEGARVVTSSDDGTARIWSVRDGNLLATLGGHTGGVRRASFDAHGFRLLTVGVDGVVRVWSSRDGGLLHTLEAYRGLEHAGFSPDASLICTAGNDGSVKLWSASDGSRRRTLVLRSGNPQHAAFSPDGARVVAGGYAQAGIWSTDDGALLQTLAGQPSQVAHAEFSPDGASILSADRWGSASVWSLRDGRLAHTLSGHFGVSHASFSSDSSMVITGGVDGGIRLWSARDGALLHVLSEATTGAVSWTAFSPDDALALTVGLDGEAKLWFVETGALATTLQGMVPMMKHAAFSSDGAFVLASSLDGHVRVWSTRDGARVGVFSDDTPITQAAFVQTGDLVLTGSQGGAAHLWSRRTGARIRSFSGHTRAITRVAVSPDGGLVLAASQDGSVRVWSAHTGALMHTLAGHTQEVRDATFSPDGSMVVTASADRTAKLWSARDGRLMRTLSGHSGALTRASFAPDSSRVLTASDDGTTRVWSTRDTGWQRTLLPSGVVFDERGRFCAPEHLAFDELHGVARARSYSLDQIAPAFNRPDLVLEGFGSLDPEHLAHLRALWMRRLHWLGLDPERLESRDDFEAPRTRVRALARTDRTLTLRVHHADRFGLTREQLRVNGVPVLVGTQTQRLSGRRVTRDHVIALNPGENVITTSSFNTRGVESSRATLTVTSRTRGEEETLYFVGFGVSAYDDPGVRDLSFAHQDVEDVSAWLAANHKASGFDRYIPVLLTEEQGTRGNLTRAAEVLASANLHDTVVVMVSGHGTYTQGEDPRYVFLTRNVDLSDLEGSAISLEDLEELLVGTRARRRLMLMDTCQSGDLPGAFAAVTRTPGAKGMQARSFTLRVSGKVDGSRTPRPWLHERHFIHRDLAWKTGALVLSSSSGLESSWEDPRWQNGAFTEALLEGLNGEADSLGGDGAGVDGRVDMRELDVFVRLRVPELTGSRQHPSLDRDNPMLDVPLRRAGHVRDMFEGPCNEGDVEACISYGEYHRELGSKRDLARALALFERACKGGGARGCIELGAHYEQGKGVPTDAARAAALFSRACASGSSARGCQRACQAGDLEGCARLASHHEKGRGVPLNLDEAVALYTRACEAGVMAGCVGLGGLRAQGRGVPKDMDEAVVLFDRACRAGALQGCRGLVWTRCEGQGVCTAELEELSRSTLAADTNGHAHDTHAFILCRRGKVKEADVTYERACELNPRCDMRPRASTHGDVLVNQFTCAMNTVDCFKTCSR